MTNRTRGDAVVLLRRVASGDVGPDVQAAARALLDRVAREAEAALEIHPHFDGETIIPFVDQGWLESDMGQVFRIMSDERPRTAQDVTNVTGIRPECVGAYMCHLRKPEFGSFLTPHIEERPARYALRAPDGSSIRQYIADHLGGLPPWAGGR